MKGNNRIYGNYDKETDTLYFEFSNNKVIRLQTNNEKNRIHYAKNDIIACIEFFNIKKGINVLGLPHEEILRKKLKYYAVKILD